LVKNKCSKAPQTLGGFFYLWGKIFHLPLKEETGKGRVRNLPVNYKVIKNLEGVKKI